MCEHESEAAASIDQSVPNDWVAYLWNCLIDGYGLFGNASTETLFENLSIITFNYDRSFERILLNALAATFPGQDAQKLLDGLPIKHVYGALSGDFEEAATAERVRDSARSIRVVFDGHYTGTFAMLHHDHIQAAERVCFLGFGFDKENRGRLRLGRYFGEQWRTGRKPTIYATTVGMKAWEVDDARRSCAGNTDCRMVFEDMGCSDFVRTHNVFEVA
jgi:hypothetical protein